MAKNKKTVDTIDLRPKQIKDVLTHNIELKIPTFVWGQPGIGKSDIVRQIAEDTDSDFVDIRLSQIEPTDIRGMPYPAKEIKEQIINNVKEQVQENTVKWAPPHFFPTDDSRKTIIFLDEMNAAPPTVQAASYQLVLDRRVGEYVLPHNSAVLAAGNRMTDRGTTFKMAKPLQNRFMHLTMVSHFEDWQEWALLKRVNKDVVGFISWSKEDLNKFDPESASHAFPTPRSWEMVSRVLPDMDAKFYDDVITAAMIAGCVGDGVALKFMEYRKNAATLPNPSDILDGKVEDLSNKDEVSLQYALSTGLCYELRDRYDSVRDMKDTTPQRKRWYQDSDNFIKFIMDNFGTEMQILAMRTAMALYKLPFNPKYQKHWERFSEENQEMVLRA